jgi:hypothetical protein
MHATLDCQSCHRNGNYRGTSSNCFSCHAKDFQKASSPPHMSSGFSTACNACHGTASWSGAIGSSPRAPILSHKTAGGF